MEEVLDFISTLEPVSKNLMKIILLYYENYVRLILNLEIGLILLDFD
jgi:hypothetical protein